MYQVGCQVHASVHIIPGASSATADMIGRDRLLRWLARERPKLSVVSPSHMQEMPPETETITDNA
jgi:hypothetical protein